MPHVYEKNHILNVFHSILGLGGVVLTHTTFTPEMHHVRTRLPDQKPRVKFWPAFQN
jgi:hypothetical protein